VSDRPRVLVYSRHSADRFRDWLAEHDAPAALMVASTPEEADAVIAEVEVILGWKVPPTIFARAPRLRWIQSMGAGVDDLMTAKDLPEQVTVTRIVDQFGSPIAEYVFAELLARVRELGRLRELQRERRWEHFIAGTLAGRHLGVAGLGSIGAEIVRKARAFDMLVSGLSRSPTQAGLVDRHFGPAGWSDFVRDLDVLVLTLPLTEATRGVVNASVLGAMRPNSVLVNVGRGALIDETALIAALRAGRPGRAILDVFIHEPLPAESPLWTMPGVTVTPHVSGPSTDVGVGTFFLENLQRYVSGEPLRGVVNRELGY